jgi:hypothetical protein
MSSSCGSVARPSHEWEPSSARRSHRRSRAGALPLVSMRNQEYMLGYQSSTSASAPPLRILPRVRQAGAAGDLAHDPRQLRQIGRAELQTVAGRLTIMVPVVAGQPGYRSGCDPRVSGGYDINGIKALPDPSAAGTPRLPALAKAPCALPPQEASNIDGEVVGLGG